MIGKILMATLLITSSCSRKIGKEAPPTPMGSGAAEHRCLHPGDPGYDINNAAPECHPDRTTTGAPATNAQPQAAPPP